MTIPKNRTLVKIQAKEDSSKTLEGKVWIEKFAVDFFQDILVDFAGGFMHVHHHGHIQFFGQGDHLLQRCLWAIDVSAEPD